MCLPTTGVSVGEEVAAGSFEDFGQSFRDDGVVNLCVVVDWLERAFEGTCALPWPMYWVADRYRIQGITLQRCGAVKFSIVGSSLRERSPAGIRAERLPW